MMSFSYTVSRAPCKVSCLRVSEAEAECRQTGVAQPLKQYASVVAGLVVESVHMALLTEWRQER
jgi:hypothetical protein